MLIPLGILASSGGGAAGSYELISTTLISSSTASVTFSSIPSTYKHLQLRYVARCDLAAENNDVFRIRFNGDTGANYNAHTLDGNGTSVSSSYSSSYIRAGYLPAATSTANAFAAGVLDILDYTNTSKYKTTRGLNGQPVAYLRVGLESGLWRNSAAISSFVLNSMNDANFIAGSRFSLYGIKG